MVGGFGDSSVHSLVMVMEGGGKHAEVGAWLQVVLKQGVPMSDGRKRCCSGASTGGNSELAARSGVVRREMTIVNALNLFLGIGSGSNLYPDPI